jgi:hypothetical protein
MRADRDCQFEWLKGIEVMDDKKCDCSIKRYNPGDPVGDGEMPVRAAFSTMNALRVELAPLNENLAPAVYCVFCGVGGEVDSNDVFKEIREATGARANNLWYRVSDDGTLNLDTDAEVVSLLEQALAVYDDDKEKRAAR